MGFQSILGDSYPRLTTIDLYPLINHPITDNKAVQKCLSYSEEGGKEVGQAYVVTTFDLCVCMKAFPLIWTFKYENHILNYDRDIPCHVCLFDNGGVADAAAEHEVLYAEEKGEYEKVAFIKDHLETNTNFFITYPSS